jgi:ABC transporter substrate binding protein
MADTSASMATASGSTFSVTSPTTLRFTVIFFVRCNFDRRFGDHAEQVHGSGPYATLVVQYSEGDRVIFFRQLRAVQQMRGYKSGWAAQEKEIAQSRTLARPGGNAIGFILFEYTLSGKWLELLKQIAPGVTRAAVLRDAAMGAGPGQFGVIQAVAPSLGVEVTPVNVRNAGEIERTVAAFARSSNGGLIVTGSALTAVHRDLIVTLADRHKLPAVYFERPFVTDGGLISYGPDVVDQYRRAAGYVDRILKGEKPADLPVQAPTKYELVIILRPPRRSVSPSRPL